MALQIGHRKSDDIDLFTNNDFDNNSLLEKLEEDFEFHADLIEKNTIKGTIQGIKVDLLAQKYTLLEIYSIEDILTFFKNKYKLRNSLHALKSLTYFEEVTQIDWPDMMENEKITWKEICRRIEAASRQYIESLNS